MKHFREETKQLREQLKQLGLSSSIQSYGKAKSLFFALLYLIPDILLLIGSIALTYFGGLCFLPMAMIIVSSRIRAIGNIQHDASHFNLCKSKKWNDRIARYVISPLVFDTFSRYRRSHNQHHALLGTEEDPDLIDTSSDYPVPWARVRQVYLRLLFRRKFWIGSTFGDIFNMNAKDFLMFGVWWTVFLTILSYAIDWRFAATFVAIVIGSRMTFYHAMRAFLEISDHAFLDPKTTISFTRTMPGSSLLTWILHPHNDNYHIAHHLFPNIPLYRLRRVHKILLKTSLYAGAHHCSTYFWGKHSVLRSWMGTFDMQ